MKTLVTGAAGFIGYHTALRLLTEGREVTGLDNLNGYYDPGLKRDRLNRLLRCPGFDFVRANIADRPAMENLFASRAFDLVIHLAAQAGVRHSVENPHLYVESNIQGFLNVLEGVRRSRIGHLVYASSSSVYGGNTKTPFSVLDRVDRPVSLYAATKRANELMAHCYSHLFEIPATGLRFFTVYGPWGRPDMAPFRFARAIDRGEPIEIYNYGKMRRDFTYIDDIVEGIFRTVERGPSGYRLFNIGGGSPVGLMAFVRALERALGKRTRHRYLPAQAGDMNDTWADAADFCAHTGFEPSTRLEWGVEQFANWYREYTARPGCEHNLALATA